MKRWLKLTSVRFAIVFLIVLILAIVITVLPARHAKKVIVEQEATSSKAAKQLQQAQTFLNSLPALDPSNIRKQGAIKFYADQARRISDQFNQLKIIAPKDIQPLFGISTAGEYKVIKDVNFTIDQAKHNAAYSDVSGDITVADKLMAYHATVSGALVNILEYDPVADTQDFDLKSNITQQRLSLARDGLTKTDQQLQAAKKIYKEPSIDEVTALISGLRYKRYQLSQDGNTADWIKVVEDAQAKIMGNRINFWKDAPLDLLKDMEKDRQEMLNLNNAWKANAAKYNVH